jgi:PAS domain S-box-containing protein
VLQDFSSLFEFCPIGVYRSSPDGRQLRANPALVRLNGYESEAQMLAEVHDIGAEWYVDPERRTQFKQQLEREGIVHDFVSEVRRHRTRERIWVREHAQAVRDTQGAIRFYEGTVEDVTADVLTREALRRSEEQMRRITDQVPALIFRSHVDAAGTRRYDFVSSGARGLFGIEPADVIANPDLLRACIHPEDLPHYRQVIEDAHRVRGPAVLEFRAITPGGDLRWVQLSSSAVSSGPSGDARIGVVVDITERKQAEQLRLERDHAETAHRTAAQLLSRVSHELRTPLNAVLGFAQLLELAEPTPEQRARWVHEILNSGRHLLGLVEDLLDLSAAQAGKQRLQAESVDVGAVLADTAAMFEHEASAGGVTLSLPQAGSGPLPAVTATADARRLRQVLSNLLSNAIKYNRPGGRVEVSMAQQGDRVEVAVADVGIGMSPEQMAHLFEPFERLGVQHLGIPGTGLGLALSRQLLDAMGGSIAVRSAPGEGSVFTLTLPAAAAGFSAART